MANQSLIQRTEQASENTRTKEEKLVAEAENIGYPKN